MIAFIIIGLITWLIGINNGFWIGLVVGIFYSKWSYYDNTENEGGREWESFRKLPIWNLLKWYIGFSVIYEDKLSIKENTAYVYAIVPHGILSFTHVFGFAIHGGQCIHPFNNGIHPLAHNLLFMIPFWREVMLWAGSKNVTKENYERFLSKGQCISVVPGAIREMLMTTRDKLEIYEQHTGFLRICKDMKINVIPVLAINENKILWPIPFIFPTIRKILLKKLEQQEERSESKIKFVKEILIILLGLLTWLASIGPFPCNLKIIVGKPIQISDQQELGDLKKLFYSNLKELENLCDNDHKIIDQIKIE